VRYCHYFMILRFMVDLADIGGVKDLWQAEKTNYLHFILNAAIAYNTNMHVKYFNQT